MSIFSSLPSDTEIIINKYRRIFEFDRIPYHIFESPLIGKILSVEENSFNSLILKKICSFYTSSYLAIDPVGFFFAKEYIEDFSRSTGSDLTIPVSDAFLFLNKKGFINMRFKFNIDFEGTMMKNKLLIDLNMKKIADIVRRVDNQHFDGGGNEE